MLSPKIELRLLDVTDAAQLRSIAIQAYQEHYADTWYDNGAWYIETYFSPSRLEEELNDEKAQFFLIYYNKDVVGFIKLNLDKPLPNEETKAVELERIYLIKNASGNGIGTCVVNFVFDIAQKQNAKIVWLKVMDTSPVAVRFYQKMGFEICGTHQVDFSQKKDGMRGMFIMKKHL